MSAVNMNFTPAVVKTISPAVLKNVSFDLSATLTRRAIELIFFAYPGAVQHAKDLGLPKPGTGSTGSPPTYHVTEFAKDADGFSYAERIEARRIMDQVRNALMPK